MKKIFFGLIALAITFSSTAQPSKQAEKKEAKTHKKEHKAKANYGKELNLTANQKNQLKVINQDFKEKMQTLKGNTNAADIKQKREALVRDHQQRINNILTPEQRLQADQLKQKRPGKGNGRFNGSGTAKHSKDGKAEKLNLTNEQQIKAKALNESYKSRIKNIDQNTALTEDQKKEQTKNLRQKHKEDIQSMLTTEQKENLKIRVKNRPSRKAVK